MAGADVVVMMTEAQAHAALAEIEAMLEAGYSSFERAMRLAATFDKDEGYKVLGYRSLAACIAGELGLSRQRGYQLIDQMKGQKLVARPKTGLVTGPTAKRERALPVTRVDREHIEDYDEAQQVASDDEYTQVESDERNGSAPTSRSAVQIVLDAATAIVDADLSVLAAVTYEQRVEFQYTFIEARNRLDSLVGTP